MAVSPWALATEDPLSEAVGRRLLGELPGEIVISPKLQKGGCGYLQSKMSSLRQISQRQAVLILTDLDRLECPAVLVDHWLRGQQPPLLLLRVAVRTVESWILADHTAMRRLLGSTVRLPDRPDELPNPKVHLLNLARRAPREIRFDLVKEREAVASQGLAYNARLSDLVESAWSPERASLRSPSLRRTRKRLLEAAVRWRSARPGATNG